MTTDVEYAAAAMAEAGVNPAREPTHAETCPLQRTDPPRLWRSSWDWDPPTEDDPAAYATWKSLAPGQYDRLCAEWEAHGKRCSQARYRQSSLCDTAKDVARMCL